MYSESLALSLGFGGKSQAHSHSEAESPRAAFFHYPDIFRTEAVRLGFRGIALERAQVPFARTEDIRRRRILEIFLPSAQNEVGKAPLTAKAECRFPEMRVLFTHPRDYILSGEVIVILHSRSDKRLKVKPSPQLMRHIPKAVTRYRGKLSVEITRILIKFYLLRQFDRKILYLFFRKSFQKASDLLSYSPARSISPAEALTGNLI